MLAYGMVIFEQLYQLVANLHSTILQSIMDSGIDSLNKNRRKTFLYNFTEHGHV